MKIFQRSLAQEGVTLREEREIERNFKVLMKRNKDNFPFLAKVYEEERKEYLKKQFSLNLHRKNLILLFFFALPSEDSCFLDFRFMKFYGELVQEENLSDFRHDLSLTSFF